jgi:hypothetical protein
MCDWGFYLFKNKDRKEKFDAIPSDTDVLITHSPPHGILDKFMDRQLGCDVLLDRVKQVKPKIHLFGHIHGANGHIEKDGINFFNCSNLSEGYQISFPCRVIEYDIANRCVKTTYTVPVEEFVEEEKVEQVEKWPGGPYPPLPEKIVLPPEAHGSTPNCVYCKVLITPENKAFTTMVGTMCIRCHWEIFD